MVCKCSCGTVHVCYDSFLNFLPLDTTVAELIKNVTDKKNFLEQIYTEQRMQLIGEREREEEEEGEGGKGESRETVSSILTFIAQNPTPCA